MLFNNNKPTLIIDKSKVLRNIDTFLQKSQKNKVVFRPHFKTHQSKEVGRWFSEKEISKITVSSLEMAKYFAENGWKDILIAFPLNIHELSDIKKLSKEIKLDITVTSIEHIKSLVAQKINDLGIYVEIDTGYHRSGISDKNTEQINEVLNLIKTNSLNFIGFLTHFGHTYKANSMQDIEAIYKQEINKLVNLKKHFENNFPHAIISIGDTPGLSQIDSFHEIDEIRPGNFVFFDYMQENLNACTSSDIAIALACPIVDINIDREQLVIYGGAIHLSKENILRNGNPFYGAIVKFNSSAWSEPFSDLFLKSLSQEHGLVHCPKSKIEDFKIGDTIGILPIHSCLTANLMKGYYDFDGNYIDHLNNF